MQNLSMKTIIEEARARDPGQTEFLQAVEEVGESLAPLFHKRPELLKVFRHMTEPERVLMFRVNWLDDKGVMQSNRGFRVQFNAALGPYKGGLRFHPSVNLSIVKFLGFEQTFKNALTTLPLGGGKGGSDFNPKGKSNNEIYKFCEAFMQCLARHIGPNTDVPAGDIGVGGREIGFLFGAYKRLQNEHVGVLTGKNAKWGGSLMRPEATGYGLVYLANYLLESKDDTMKGKRVCVSGSGNVAKFAARKLMELGAKVITLSDSSGTVYEKDGFTSEQLDAIDVIKDVQRGRISEYALKISKTAVYTANARPWQYECDIAMPCATQNEVELQDAQQLIDNGCKLLAEGANMPSTNDALKLVLKAGMMYLPAKAANAGGVAVSGLEMSQNSARLSWSSEEVDEKLKAIMLSIFESCQQAAAELDQPGNFQLGANAAGFIKVAESMLEQGYVL